MNGKDLLDKMSDVDPKLIENAENSNRKPKNKRRMFIGLTSGMATVAAAAVLAVAIGKNPAVTPPIDLTSDTNSGVVSDTNSAVISDPGNNSGGQPTASTPAAPVIKDPPVIDFSEYEHLPVISSKAYGVGGMGGGVSKGSSKTYSELEIHSPWSSELNLKTMPVYKSTSTEADLNDLRDYVIKAAAALGISESELELEYPGGTLEGNLDALRKMMENAGVSEEEIERELEWRKPVILGNAGVEGRADGVHFSTMTAYGLEIRFDPAEKLPDGCRLGDNATEEEELAAVKYLAEKYKDLMGYEEPVITKNWDYGHRTFAVYEGTGDIKEQIFNYSTKYTRFRNRTSYPDDFPDELESIYTPSNVNCVKLDDYPVYTAEQVVQILQSNKFSDEERMPEDAKILKIDMIYNNNPGYTVVLPYYEIYVETDGTPIDGEDLVCDIYRICAVPEQFVDIENSDYGVSA